MADPRSAGVPSLERIESWLQRARVIIDRLVVEQSENSEFGSFRTRIYVKLGGTLERLNRVDEAEACYREAIAFLGHLIDRTPGHDPLRIDRATAREALALTALDRGRSDLARTLLDLAVADLQIVRTSDRFPPPISTRLKSIALAFKKLGDADRAREMTRWAVEDEARPHHPPPGAGGRRRRPPRTTEPR